MDCKSLIRTTVGVALLLAIPAASWSADDGAALYKTKCAGCHGASGEGKPAMKAPALKGTALDADKITDHITKGEPQSKPPHKKGMAGVTEAQAKAIAEFIKTLK
jgi:mono/diheme cytochrome c family protein